MKYKNNEDIEKLAYSLDEVSEMLGVSKNTLRNEQSNGRLDFLKLRRRTLITRKSLEKFLSELEGGENVK